MRHCITAQNPFLLCSCSLSIYVIKFKLSKTHKFAESRFSFITARVFDSYIPSVNIFSKFCIVFLWRICAREELRCFPAATPNSDTLAPPLAVCVRFVNTASRKLSFGELPAVNACFLRGAAELSLAIFYSISLRCCSIRSYMFEFLRCDCFK